MSRVISSVAQLGQADVYRELIEIGAVVGSIAALGGVAGFLAGADVRTLRPARSVSYGEWVTYTAGLAGTGALFFELFERAGL
jgi:hypothetical protein